MNDESGDMREGPSQEPGGPFRQPEPIRRWKEKKEYTNPSEKKRDFWLGFGLWFGGNIALYILIQLLLVVLALPLSAVSQQALGLSWLFLLPSLLALLLNVIAIIYFAFTRRFIGLGMLAAFGSLLLLTICAALLFAGVCFILANWGAT
ncbi:MAG: hypothetical protein ACM3QS_14990 [Bacteroidota bacterium]